MERDGKGWIGVLCAAVICCQNMLLIPYDSMVHREYRSIHMAYNWHIVDRCLIRIMS